MLGMAKDFYDNFKSAKNVFELVEDITKIKVKKIVFENTDNLLILQNTLKYVFTQFQWQYLRFFMKLFKNTSLFDINFVLGHSLGEYSALTASKSIMITDCAKLSKNKR